MTKGMIQHASVHLAFSSQKRSTSLASFKMDLVCRILSAPDHPINESIPFQRLRLAKSPKTSLAFGSSPPWAVGSFGNFGSWHRHCSSAEPPEFLVNLTTREVLTSQESLDKSMLNQSQSLMTISPGKEFLNGCASSVATQHEFRSGGRAKAVPRW